MSPLVAPFVAAAGGFLAASLGVASARTLLSGRVAEPGVRASPLVVEPPPLVGVARLFARVGLLIDPQERAAVAEELVQAGFDDRVVTPLWFVIRGASTLLPLPPVWLLVRDQRAAVVVAVLAATLAAGWVAPAIGLRVATQVRQRRLRRAVPTLLDMLVTTLGAGLGFDAALAHVAEEIAFVSPALAKEIEDVRARTGTGTSRQEALRELARRVRVEEIEALVSLLGQSERYGVGVATALREHAEAARRRRLLEAEQRATRVAGMLTVVMVLLVLPAVLVVLVGPMIFDVTDAIQGVEEAR